MLSKNMRLVVAVVPEADAQSLRELVGELGYPAWTLGEDRTDLPTQGAPTTEASAPAPAEEDTCEVDGVQVPVEQAVRRFGPDAAERVMNRTELSIYRSFRPDRVFSYREACRVVRGLGLRQDSAGQVLTQMVRRRYTRRVARGKYVNVPTEEFVPACH